MRRILTAAAVAIGLATATAAVAPAPAHAQSAADQRFMREANIWLEQAARWSAPYGEVLGQTYELLAALSEGALKAQEFAERGDTRAGKAWAEPWAAEQRARLGALKARLQSLSPTPPPAKGPGYDLTNMDGMRDLQRMFTEMPKGAQAQVALAETLMGRYLDLTVRAASGDEAAAEQIAPAYFDLQIAMLRSEISMYEAYLPTMDARGSPQGDLIRAGAQVNLAFIAVYELVAADLRGQGGDRAAVARTVRASADGIESRLRTTQQRVDRVLGELPPGELKTKMAAISTSIAETVKAYRVLAGQLRTTAAEVEKGDRFDAEAVLASMEAMVPTLERIIELDKQRRGAIAR